jgi:hypothetical protein
MAVSDCLAYREYREEPPQCCLCWRSITGRAALIAIGDGDSEAIASAHVGCAMELLSAVAMPVVGVLITAPLP